MEEYFIILWEAIYNIVVAFLNSTVFFVIKIFLAIYTTVLVVDVILLMYLGNVRKQLRELRKGSGNVKITKRTDVSDWAMITNRLNSQDEKQYRAAILEADQMVYKSLEIQGYSGGNFAERIAQVPPDSFTALNVVRDVHVLSKKIILDDKLRITKDQAQNALDVYEKFLKNLDIL